MKDEKDESRKDIVFDEKFGISVEEQKEILSQINGISEKNRQKLSQAITPGAKKGFVFPVIVNIAAVILLLAGVLLIVLFSKRTDALYRTGNAVYSITERALIEEIRKDTAELIAAKEREIEIIALRMEEVDEELLKLYSSNVSLTAVQLASRENLLAMQAAYRGELNILQEERSQILETSRAREARLRSLLEERTRDQMLVSGELDSARSEMEKLTAEQEKASAIEAHFTGGITSIASLVQNRQYDQAAQSIINLRDFINSASVSKREYYNQSLNLMETLLNEARRNSGTPNPLEQLELLAKIAQLEDTISELQRTISASASGSSGQASRISELETSAAGLRNTITSLEQASSQKDAAISALQAENASLTSAAAELRTSNSAFEQEIANLRNQISIIRQALLDNNQ
ncbi:MAG: hypothetical protein FWD26_08800 [Treponema sp.]|nr:hypothetical protein [Treponema sp.]